MEDEWVRAAFNQWSKAHLEGVSGTEEGWEKMQTTSSSWQQPGRCCHCPVSWARKVTVEVGEADRYGTYFRGITEDVCWQIGCCGYRGERRQRWTQKKFCWVYVFTLCCCSQWFVTSYGRTQTVQSSSLLQEPEPKGGKKDMQNSPSLGPNRVITVEFQIGLGVS